ncbi:MAG: DUF6114 domain-containing protein [Solirubrobacterales bacterium]
MKRMKMPWAYSMLGLYIGTLVGLRTYHEAGAWWAAAAVVVVTLAFGPCFGSWIANQPERDQNVAAHGIAGTLIGFFAAVTAFKSDPQIIGLCVLAGGICFGAGFGLLVNLWKQSSRYEAYRGDAFWISVLGCFGALIGYGLSLALMGIRGGALMTGAYLPTIVKLLMILILSSIMSLAPGILFAANRKRPAIGALFVTLGGALVLWVGISIAPILFLPGSGLYWSGMVMGLVLTGLGFMAGLVPRYHLGIGLAAMVFSILSFVGAAGGLLVGGLLGLTGGAFLVSWIEANPASSEIPQEQPADAGPVVEEVNHDMPDSIQVNEPVYGIVPEVSAVAEQCIGGEI